MLWSRLDSSIIKCSQDIYEWNDCEYHNWEHILDCYNFLHEENVPYSQDLDFAVLDHDVVYDNQPNKELRSAVLADPTKGSVYQIIMATVDHKISNETSLNEKWMIKADLHPLRDSDHTIENYAKIMKESMRLYGVDERAFAVASRDFMINLENTMIENYEVDSDRFWLEVLWGIRLTQNISRMLIV